MKKIRINTAPKAIFEEYKKGSDHKAGLGDKGLFEQSRINERFYIGDHWHGAKCGSDRPLVRRNVIRRLADYKLSCIGSAPIAVNYSAEGVTACPMTAEERMGAYEGDMGFKGEVTDGEISTVMQLLSDYSRATMERLSFDSLVSEALRDAYISGTGIIYTYWNEETETGLFTDSTKTVPIRGDIASETVDIENVVFGDPYTRDIAAQPFIIIASRRRVEDVKREAKRNGISADEILEIKPDCDYSAAHSDDARVTVLTKFYKVYASDGRQHIMCVKTTENATVKRPFDIGISIYPIARLFWDSRKNCAYGESEITYLIPNQIAINRALSAEVWGTMLNGMPIMLQNGDVITGEVSGDPGQVIKVYGAENDIEGALRYIQPPSFAGQMLTSINDLASNTLSDSGANDAALGNVRPDNAAAIIQMREAALQPLQLKQNQYYAFIEDVMRIWSAFWISHYSNRCLKVSTERATLYIPFSAERYRNLLINARVDIGASTLWSTSVVVSTLDSLLEAGIITPIQYLERIPSGLIPDKTGLIEDLRGQNGFEDEVLGEFSAEHPELYGEFMRLPEEERQGMLSSIRFGGEII